MMKLSKSQPSIRYFVKNWNQVKSRTYTLYFKFAIMVLELSQCHQKLQIELNPQGESRLWL